MNKTTIVKQVKENFPSGLVVFLVALPLCLGIALASGAPPLSGIIAGIVGGIVVGYLSNSNISVAGPAAGIVAIVLGAITELGSFDLFLCTGIIAGIIQLLLGVFRAGSISNFFPNNVIEGMLAGIGIIIIFKQIPHAIGLDEDYEGNQRLFQHGLGVDKYFFRHIMESVENLFGSIHPGAIIVTLVSMGILLMWDHINILRKIKLLPGALVAVIIGILLNEVFKATGSKFAIGREHLVTLPVPKTLGDFKNLIDFPNFKGFLIPRVWVIGATIAAVASIETLLSIEAADRIDPKKRITDTNLELRAQGIGNMISALIGGLPMTSVIVRSSANATAGATSKASTIIHGILLLICVLTIPMILNLIPLATLAAVLILVGYKLAKPSTFLHFWKYGWYQFIPFIATALAVVFLDLLYGVGIGLAISIFYILEGNMKRAYYLSREELDDTKELTIRLAEEVSFLNKAAIKKTLKNIKPNSVVTINAENSSYIDTEVLEIIQDFTNVLAKEENITVNLVGFEIYEKKSHDNISRVSVKHKNTI
ncbi:MAG: SulP family inorganic anion transporter [Bergeyella sp.]|nr:SulP family inorganic anion transporter [Bergeyella sp.]